MKATRYIYIAALAFLAAACEVIPVADRYIPVEITRDTTETDTIETWRTCLLIDFSGWRCVNCPNAAEEAHKLLEYYNQKVEQLIVIEAHPATNSLTAPPARYPEYDYTCPAADALYLAMRGTNTTPFPTGVVNMKQQPDGSYFRDYSLWLTDIDAALQTNDSLDIEFTGISDTEITYTLTNHAAIDKQCTIYMWLTEDSLVCAQYMPDNTTTTEYLRNHLLRDAILPQDGQPVTLPSNTPVENTVAYTLPENVVPKNCHIVAAIYYNGQIIQAAQTNAYPNPTETAPD